MKYADINKFLYRGALTIQVEATLLCLTEPTECTHQRKPLENNVLAGNKSLFEDKLLSDVMIKCGDAEFKAHKAILASQSPVFKKMLESDMKEQRTNVIEISDVDQAVILICWHTSTLAVHLTWIRSSRSYSMLPINTNYHNSFKCARTS